MLVSGVYDRLVPKSEIIFDLIFGFLLDGNDVHANHRIPFSKSLIETNKLNFPKQLLKLTMISQPKDIFGDDSS